MSFVQTVLKFPLNIVQFFRRFLNSISSKVIPNFLRPFLSAFRQKSEFLYRATKATVWSGLFGSVLFAVFFATVYMGYWGKIPDYSDLKNIEKAQASELYSIDNKILGKFYLENRTSVDYKSISPYILNSLVATEDKRFFEHDGIDFLSYFRVFFKTILLRDHSSGGGSTISQQLAKNLFGRAKKYGKMSTLVAKTKEFILARRLENLYSKQEILTAYLNTVSFGEDTYGIENAALLFYNKKPNAVTIDEAALLAGLLQAPGSYNPRLHPEKALNRRNIVLKNLQNQKHISQKEYDLLSKKPLGINYNPNAKNDGVAPYFRERLRNELDEKIKDLRKPDGSEYNLYTDGLKVYCTIDSRMQAYAEQAVQLHMAKLQKAFDQVYSKSKPWGKANDMVMNEFRNSDRYEKLDAQGLSEEQIMAEFKKPTKMKVFSYDDENYEKEVTFSPWDSVVYYHALLSCGFMAMDPRNGQIRAWVGGVDFKHRKFDHVTARRQVGSTFKPIVYAAALEQGQLPCDYLANQIKTYPAWENWRPENSENLYGGFYSMKGALTKSLNTISVQLCERAGIDNVINLANRMGISSEIPHKLAISLGSADITLREMVGAYATLAAQGTRHAPVYLLRVEDRTGRVLKTFEQPPPEGEQVLADSLARYTIEMMRGVVDNGTGSRLRSMFGLRNDIAGKTGTTQNQTDGWFIGCTPNIVAGAWVGGDDPAVRFKSLALGQGANTSLPIFATFLQKVYADASLTNYRSFETFPAMSDTLAEWMACPDFTERPDSVRTPQNAAPENMPVKPENNDEKNEGNKEKLDANKPKENGN